MKDSSWLQRHFNQDAGVLATLVAFGASTVAIAIAISIRHGLADDSSFALAVGALPIVFLPGPIVLVARLVRGSRRTSGRCEACGARPAADVRYLQVTGIVVVALMRELRMNARAAVTTATSRRRRTAASSAGGCRSPRSSCRGSSSPTRSHGSRAGPR